MTERPMPLKVECITFPEKRGPTTLAGPHGEAPGLVGRQRGVEESLPYWVFLKEGKAGRVNNVGLAHLSNPGGLQAIGWSLVSWYLALG